MLPWQRYIRQLNYQKVEVCVVNLFAAIFGDQRINGFREKCNETEVSKTVFSHLKERNEAEFALRREQLELKKKELKEKRKKDEETAKRRGLNEDDGAAEPDFVASD